MSVEPQLHIDTKKQIYSAACVKIVKHLVEAHKNVTVDLFESVKSLLVSSFSASVCARLPEKSKTNFVPAETPQSNSLIS